MYEPRTRCPKAYDCGSQGIQCIHASVGKIAVIISGDRLKTVCDTTGQLNCTGPSRIEQSSPLEPH
jgi:hypothetical protein